MMYSTSDQPVEEYRVWFNSPSNDVSSDKWLDNSTRYYTLEEITYDSTDHTVTHLIVEDEIPPDFHSVFPQLTHLRLKNVKWNPHFLDR